MKITKIDMIYPQAGTLIEGEQIPCIWVRIHTDEGITGLGIELKPQVLDAPGIEIETIGK